MNYADFGVSGPDELEQDEWSLTRPTFETPKGGLLTVLGWKNSRERYLIVKCSVCSQDKELFGNGVFKIGKGDLIRGRIPCGCSVRTFWSEKQQKIRVSREAERQGYAFLGWEGLFERGKTKCRLVCPEHGAWNTTIIDRFLQGRGCPHCKVGNLKEDTLHKEGFRFSGAFIPGTEFWRSEREDSRGYKVYWNYTCPRCSHDEYVRAGLCNGVFESLMSHLKNGGLSCRCSTGFIWSREQREYQIKKEMSRRFKSGISNLEFVGWSEKGYTNNTSKFIYLCPDHGVQATSVDGFLYKFAGCPQCAGATQRQAYINTVKDGEIPVALKLGVANDSARRIREQNNRNLFQSTRFGVWAFATVISCKAAEDECKKDLACGVLSAREMKEGWTETVSLLDLEKVIAIYEKHGGIRIK